MEIYCRPLEDTSYLNYIKYREIFSGQETLILAIGINLLEIACKLKGTNQSIQIFQLLEELLNKNTVGTHGNLFKELLSILKNAGYAYGVLWLEQYITQGNNSELLCSIRNTILLALDIENFQVTQQYLDYVSDKLNININIEGYFKSSSPQQRLVINVNYSADDSIWYLLYTEKFFNYYKNTEVPIEFYSNPVKKLENSENLVNTLIKILRKKNLFPENMKKLLAYKSETNDSRVDSLITPTSGPDFERFPLSKVSCVVCSKPTQCISPIYFCKTHPICIPCASTLVSCPKCQHPYSDESLSFLVNN